MYPQDPYYRLQMAATLRNMKRLKDSLHCVPPAPMKRCPDRQDTGTEGILLYLYTLLDLDGPACSSSRQGRLSGGRSRYWENGLIFVFYAGFFI